MKERHATTALYKESTMSVNRFRKTERVALSNLRTQAGTANMTSMIAKRPRSIPFNPETYAGQRLYGTLTIETKNDENL